MTTRALRSLVAVSILLTAAGAHATPYSSEVLFMLNPTLYWELNETSGTTAFDSANSYDGTYRPGATLGQAGPRSTSGGPNDFGGPFPQMGPTNFAPNNVPGGGNGTVFTGLSTLASVSTSTYSMAAWFNSSQPFSSLVLSYFLSRGELGGTRDSVGVLGTYDLPNAGKLFVYDGSATVINGTTVLAPDTWYNVVMTRNGNNVALYLNGDTATPEINTAMPWFGGIGNVFVGGGRSDNALALQGRYDEVMVWNRVLTNAEIEDLYEAAFTSIIPVPEPTTFSLLSLGAIGLAIKSRRRRAAV